MSSERDGAAWAEVQSNPRNHAAWHYLAVRALQAGRGDIAIGYAQRAHELARRNGEYLATLGIALVEGGRLDEGIGVLERAVKLAPASPEARSNLANALGKARRLDDALDAYRNAHALAPGRIDLKARLGGALWRLGRSGEALPFLREVYETSRDDREAIVDFANVMVDVEGMEAAVAFLRRELGRLPGEPWLRFRLAQALLSLGHWEQGWEEYLWRPSGMRDAGTPLPERLPEDLKGRRVLLLPDQGLGDMLFFLRFAENLARRGAQASFCAPAKLLPLLKGQRLHFEVVESDVPADFRASLSDLPYLGRELGSPPALTLRARADLLDRWRAELARLGKPPYIGVTWRAGTDPAASSEFSGPSDLLFKEIDPALLGSALVGVSGTLVAVQRFPAASEMEVLGHAAGRSVHDLSAVNEDLEEMAALLCALDDYVGVSNTNTHIRAGLGLPGKTLVPYPPEFRWMAQGGESPWFPGFRVYRQSAARDWTEALRELRSDL
jgi:tetratricopeptide (TPR) repeat protein